MKYISRVFKILVIIIAIFGINKRKYISDECEVDMYNYIRDTLTSNGYKQYEISNYSRDNYQSKHNLNYWNNGSYYGFGMGAVSFLDNYRIINTKRLTKYIEHEFILEKVFENINLQISNTFMLGFRMIKGIDIEKFRDRYHKNILDILKVRELLEEGKLEFNNNYLFITKKYFYLSNEIIMEFI